MCSNLRGKLIKSPWQSHGPVIMRMINDHGDYEDDDDDDVNGDTEKLE